MRWPRGTVVIRRFAPGQPVLPAIRNRKHGLVRLAIARIDGGDVLAGYAIPKE